MDRNGVIFVKPKPGSEEMRGQVLMRVKSRKPFDLFPDEIVVDRHKVTLIRRPFFWAERIVSLAFEDISNVTIDHGIMFASLEIAHKIFGMPPLMVQYLDRTEANLVKRLLLGIIIAKKEGNKELFNLDRKELIEQAQQVGKGHSQ